MDDAYSRILRYESEGRLRIRHYEDLTVEERRRDRNMVRGAIRRLDLLRGEHPLSGFVSGTPGMVGGSAAGGRGRRRRMTARRLEKTDLAAPGGPVRAILR